MENKKYSKYKKVFIVARGGAVTGGPELLHQLVHALRNIKVDAYISYYPFDKQFDVPLVYQKYNVVQSNIEDAEGNLIVFPEVFTALTSLFSNSTIAIWWLSVDNYFGCDMSSLKGRLRSILNLLLGRRKKIKQMRNYMHFSQSYYAYEFLKNNGLAPQMLTDYLSSVFFLGKIDDSKNKKNVILYNPKKGISVTKRLKKYCVDYEFQPLINLTPVEMMKKMRESKLYIDFGNHPGKDRIPREAVMSGCCLITGKKGSAGNDFDVSIPNEFKISEAETGFEEKFREKVEDIFMNFDENSKKLMYYRNSIKNEENMFLNQVESLFVLNENCSSF